MVTECGRLETRVTLAEYWIRLVQTHLNHRIWSITSLSWAGVTSQSWVLELWSTWIKTRRACLGFFAQYIGHHHKSPRIHNNLGVDILHKSILSYEQMQFSCEVIAKHKFRMIQKNIGCHYNHKNHFSSFLKSEKEAKYRGYDLTWWLIWSSFNKSVWIWIPKEK